MCLRMLVLDSKSCYLPCVTLMAVKSCSKVLLEPSLEHEKSPCFSDVTTTQLVSPDYLLLALLHHDETDFLECAF